MKNISLDILPDGTIRFVREDVSTNEQLLKIIAEISPSSLEESKRFLDGAKQIEVLMGSESLCG